MMRSMRIPVALGVLTGLAACGSRSPTGADVSLDGSGQTASDGSQGSMTGVPASVSDASAQDAFDAAEAVDAGDAECHLECPSTRPTPGATCASVPNEPGLDCQYPLDSGLDCVESFECMSGAYARFTDCNDFTAGCPATFDDVPVGAACTTANTNCAYPGHVCDCDGFPADAGPSDASIGDGAAGDGAAGWWSCFAIPATCPQLPPLTGTPCTGNTSCSYARGVCGGDFGNFYCACDVWQEAPVAPCAP